MHRATRRRGRRVLAALIALAAPASLATALATPAAAAAGDRHPRVAPVAASSDYLLYRQKTATRQSMLSTAGSTLHWIGRTGGRHLLTGFDPERFPDLQGSVVSQRVEAPSSASAPEHVRWHDLRTGAAGVTELPATDDWAGAAPGGWLTVRRTGAVATDGEPIRAVVRWSTSGSTTDLGAPFPGGAPFSVHAGPTGVVAASGAGTDDAPAVEPAGAVRTAGFAAGRRGWRTVYDGGSGVDVLCGRPSATHVACEAATTDPKRTGLVLVALDGGRLNWLSTHRGTCQVGGFAAVGSSLVVGTTARLAACAPGEVIRLGAKGGLAVSKRHYGRPYPTAGLGRILLETKEQRGIIALTGVTGRPRTVVRAH